MQSLAVYVDECRELSAEAFCERHPDPFLLYSIASAGPLTPVGPKGREPTVDRLVVGGRKLPAGTPAAQGWYAVYEIRSKDPEARRVSIGCSLDCDVVLDDASISRLHAWFNRTEHAWYLQDADSSAGTAVNGRTVSGSDAVRLASGDRISLGTVDTLFLPPEVFHAFVLRMAGR